MPLQPGHQLSLLYGLGTPLAREGASVPTIIRAMQRKYPDAPVAMVQTTAANTVFTAQALPRIESFIQRTFPNAKANLGNLMGCAKGTENIRVTVEVQLISKETGEPLGKTFGTTFTINNNRTETGGPRTIGNYFAEIYTKASEAAIGANYVPREQFTTPPSTIDGITYTESSGASVFSAINVTGLECR